MQYLLNSIDSGRHRPRWRKHYILHAVVFASDFAEVSAQQLLAWVEVQMPPAGLMFKAAQRVQAEGGQLAFDTD
jgi:hypothetical protein